MSSLTKTFAATEQAAAPRRWTNSSTLARLPILEDKALENAVAIYNGRNWKAIAALVPGRSEAECRHRWEELKDEDEEKAKLEWTKAEHAAAAVKAGEGLRVVQEGNFMKIENTKYIDFERKDLDEQLNALTKDCFNHYYRPVPTEILYAIVDNSGRILSYLSVSEDDLYSYSIWNVCTSSQFRKQGWMNMLLTKVMKDLVDNMGAVEIKLGVSHKNPPRDRLMSMYRNHGFQVSGWDARSMIMTWKK